MLSTVMHDTAPAVAGLPLGGMHGAMQSAAQTTLSPSIVRWQPVLSMPQERWAGGSETREGLVGALLRGQDSGDDGPHVGRRSS